LLQLLMLNVMMPLILSRRVAMQRRQYARGFREKKRASGRARNFCEGRRRLAK